MGNFRSQDFSFPGTFVPLERMERKFHGTFVPGPLHYRELSFPGPFILRNFRSQDFSFPGTFVPPTILQTIGYKRSQL